jgi:hypothetical protein
MFHEKKGINELPDLKWIGHHIYLSAVIKNACKYKE